MIYNEKDLRPQQLHVLKLRQQERSKETLATMVNSLEDLSLFQNTTPNQQLKRELALEINNIMKVANESKIDVPKTLAKFYKMADSNEIFTYVQNLRDNIVIDGEPE